MSLHCQRATVANSAAILTEAILGLILIPGDARSVLEGSQPYIYRYHWIIRISISR